MTKLLAQFGQIDNPFKSLNGPASYVNSTKGEGLVTIFNTLMRTAIIIAGLYALINFILAGYGFLSAGGDSKAVSKAWEKIWQSLIGLLVAVSAVLLAALFGYLLFGDASAITTIRIIEPK